MDPNVSEMQIPCRIAPPNPPNDGILFVDHSQQGRSGHLGHALVETAPGRVLAFHSNVSGEINGGHNGDGWMEVRRSEDGGRTWSDSIPLEYSKQVHDAGEQRSVMCEKAVCTREGTVVLLNLECGNVPEKKCTWQPLYVPTVLRSSDGGNTWSEPLPMGDEPGRIWDALVKDGEILVLELCNDHKDKWHATLPEHHYALYVSDDDGRTFARRSVLPFHYDGRGYGTMAFLHDGSLIADVYNIHDEQHLDYAISPDNGRTWSDVQTARMEKRIRNPQMAPFKDGFVLHGRSGHVQGPEAERGHLVLYTSRDGIRWDGGQYLQMRTARHGAYSNNLWVHDPDDSSSGRLLIQASHAYDHHRTNIHHWWLS